MDKEKMNQIIDEAYKNYQWKQPKSFPADPDSNLSKEEFINRCKTNPEFSEKWGLKIEERGLTFEERCEIYVKKLGGVYSNEVDIFIKHCTEDIKLIKMNENNIPTKLITITYNNETKTEIYE